MSLIIRFLSFTLVSVSLIAVLLSGVSGFAEKKATPNLDKVRANDCASAKTPLTVLALMTPGQFFPIIPNACGGGDGAPQALSLTALPVILVRVYGLLASLVFYLFGFNLIFISIRASYGAFQEAEYKNALNMFQEGVTSIALVLLAHLIISTIFSTIFRIPLITDVSTIQGLFN